MAKKVTDIITQLGPNWKPIDGLFAITGVTVADNGQVSFHPDNGVVIKAFIDSLSGEIKLFPAKILGFPDEKNL